MIIDVNAWVGHWPFRPVPGGLDTVCRSLCDVGVERMFMSPLDGVWCRDPTHANEFLYRAASNTEDVWSVPLLDPGVRSWASELERAAREVRARFVKLVPKVGGYDLPAADALIAAAGAEGLGVIVQTRMEDPRRQHPLAQVGDLAMREIAEAARRHSDVTVIAGGPRPGEIVALREDLLTLPNFYADISQCDGVGAVARMVEEGLAERLVFGSHAPLFIPASAVARVATDLDDGPATAILRGNAMRILGEAT